MEHDACGVGFVAARDGKPNRAVVDAAIEALQAIWHRGAVDADGMTGDGAGIHIEIPRDFFIEHIGRTGHDDDGGRLAVGMVFLPRADLAAQERCRCIVEREILAVGHYIYGWRQVPVDIRALGAKARATRPEIEQIMFSMPSDMMWWQPNASVSCPAPDRKSRFAAYDHRFLHLFDVKPVNHLQRHVFG